MAVDCEMSGAPGRPSGSSGHSSCSRGQSRAWHHGRRHCPQRARCTAFDLVKKTCGGVITEPCGKPISPRKVPLVGTGLVMASVDLPRLRFWLTRPYCQAHRRPGPYTSTFGTER